MWLTIDCETLGLDARKFVLGSICDEKMRTRSFYDKKKMMDYLLGFQEQCEKRGERLTLYGHNMQYDYICLGGHLDPKNVIYCTRPFIADRIEGEYTDRFGAVKKKSWLKWMDSMGLWRGSLADIGNCIGMPKTETPQWLIDGDETGLVDQVRLWEAARYCEQDCKVLMTFLLGLKKRLHDVGIKPWMMLTGAQLSTAYTLKKMSEHPNSENWFEDFRRRAFWETRNKEHVRLAYRGGRVEAFITGKREHVNHYDLNSLYPYAVRMIDFPDLRTEHHLTDPIGHGMQLSGLLSCIGVSTVIIKTPKTPCLGYLAIREKDDDGNESSSYPTTDETGQKVLVGTWTHLELQKAVSLGYIVHFVSESTLWQTATGQDGLALNPLTSLMDTLYTARKTATTPFDDAFFKLLMNGVIGKFAQRREHVSTCLADIEDLPTLRLEGWETTGNGGSATCVLLERKEGMHYPKHYLPIVAAYITAAARDILYGYLSRFPTGSLLYTDTDCIICDRTYSVRKDRLGTQYRRAIKHIKSRIGEGLGQWKILTEDGTYHAYRKKAYRVDDNIRIARIPRRAQTFEAFETGSITFPEIYGITEAPTLALVGGPKITTRTLDYPQPRTIKRVIVDTNEPITPRLFARLKEHLRNTGGMDATWQSKEVT